jgi:hypothetical protein
MTVIKTPSLNGSHVPGPNPGDPPWEIIDREEQLRMASVPPWRRYYRGWLGEFWATMLGLENTDILADFVLIWIWFVVLLLASVRESGVLFTVACACMAARTVMMFTAKPR